MHIKQGLSTDTMFTNKNLVILLLGFTAIALVEAGCDSNISEVNKLGEKNNSKEKSTVDTTITAKGISDCNPFSDNSPNISIDAPGKTTIEGNTYTGYVVSEDKTEEIEVTFEVGNLSGDWSFMGFRCDKTFRYCANSESIKRDYESIDRGNSVPLFIRFGGSDFTVGYNPYETNIPSRATSGQIIDVFYPDPTFESPFEEDVSYRSEISLVNYDTDKKVKTTIEVERGEVVGFTAGVREFDGGCFDYVSSKVLDFLENRYNWGFNARFTYTGGNHEDAWDRVKVGPPKAEIRGPRSVNEGSRVSWSANDLLPGGERVVSYRWKRDDNVVSTDPSYATGIRSRGGSRFALTLEVETNTGRELTAGTWVNVKSNDPGGGIQY